ncbi:hypothetical protein NLJ89_g5430 [Agrocybe chaxingu]|uniref:Uncharacterized protein n=1 Tax=Agrocybe chaxingu TaxID=84603 RepID=A0A9W8K079_9AGAR|nr:hypothetical protein NLJ89_g5430 [Agrocybe chaxingu]
MPSPPQPVPPLPLELIDRVIDKIAELPNNHERRNGLASSHRHLFALITFRLGTTQRLFVQKKLSALRNIINADPHSETTGIASHIRDFCVNVLGLFFRRVFTDDTLAAIQRRLFRTREGRLSLIVGGGSEMDWGKVGKDFESAFFDLCRNSQMTALQLGGFNGLPLNVFHGPNIKHIEISRLDSWKSAMQGFNQEPIRLKSISTDHSAPILDLLRSESNPRSTQWLFSKFKGLNTSIYKDEHVTQTMSIISCAPALDTLVVEVSASVCGTPVETLIWTQIPNLRRLKIVHKEQFTRECLEAPSKCAAIRILDILEDPSPSLKALCLDFIIYPLNLAYGESLRHYNYASIDAALVWIANTRYRHVEHFIIRSIGQFGLLPPGFNGGAFVAQEDRRFKTQFPLLYEKCPGSLHLSFKLDYARPGDVLEGEQAGFYQSQWI